MTRTEQIRKARQDVDTLQRGLDKVGVVLENAEEVAVLGERARSRAPLILLSLAGTAVLTGGVVYLVRRRRRSLNDADRPY
jgi:LPXTG-motif cell wall-anchored protein